MVGGFDRVVSALEMKGKVVEARGHHLPRCGGGLIIGSPLLLYFYPYVAPTISFNSNHIGPTECLPLLTYLLCA